MPSQQNTETFISVDVETAGPNPGTYALLSIGACTLGPERHTFYVELQPDKPAFQADALAVSGLSLERLAAQGQPPQMALQQWEDWLKTTVPPGNLPLFVGFNAPFDWMFVNDYFLRYLGHNPFGHSALDIKSFFMGLYGSTWLETGMWNIAPRYLDHRQLSHHALEDAIDQALIFEKLLAEARARQPGE